MFFFGSKLVPNFSRVVVLVTAEKRVYVQIVCISEIDQIVNVIDQIVNVIKRQRVNKKAIGSTFNLTLTK